MPSVHLTAVQEAESWFQAVNAKDRDAFLAHFDPSSRRQADWYRGDVSLWAYTDVRCNGTSAGSMALVHCTFKSHGDMSSSSDTFWNIELHRTNGGPWLITGYGQG